MAQLNLHAIFTFRNETDYVIFQATVPLFSCLVVHCVEFCFSFASFTVTASFTLYV